MHCSYPIRSITPELLQTPFRRSFSHASATRDHTETLLVRVELEKGQIGFGESCPRSYVTGENLQTAMAFCQYVMAEVVAQVSDMKSLRHWVQCNRIFIDKNPAAWCALELALLDAFSRAAGKSVEQCLELPSITGREFRYSAVLDNSSPPAFESMLNGYLSLSIRDFKLKLSGDFGADNVKIAALRRKAVKYRLRLDGNNLWHNSATAIDYLKRLGSPLYAVEEPVQADDYEAMAEIAAAVGCKIILDESFLTLGCLKKLKPFTPQPWLLNLRVSKLGGLLRSIEILDRARELGIPVIIGAQVGETSLLSRVALTLASRAGPHLIAQEGAFSTLLLRKDIFHPNLMFGRGGRLTPQVGPLGFGMQRAL
ncbi:mandelate racemase/muconate lactonizing enzyme family protein [Microbulbifer sp. TYP-18]|uniref:mandelate racemase/muconate lactonizing enzyme family protein n=1 Tax=Microbulbifer sp. TYP-18 TaxID=3230024 RepID=UPI0034C63234